MGALMARDPFWTSSFFDSMIGYSDIFAPLRQRGPSTFTVEEGKIIVEIDAPGARKGELRLQLEGDYLVASWRRHGAEISSSHYIGKTIVGASAKLEDGVIRVVLETKQTKPITEIRVD